MAVVGLEYQFLYHVSFLYLSFIRRGQDTKSDEKSIRKEDIKPLISQKPILLSNTYDTPYVCVRDEAFPLSSYMIKSYPKRDLCLDLRTFIHRLSHARQISEYVYCILANRWQMLRKPFLLKLVKFKEQKHIQFWYYMFSGVN